MNTLNNYNKTHQKPDSITQIPPNASKEFAPVLRRVCIAAWLLKLFPIPIGLLNAWLLSRIVTCAVAGDSGSVLKNGTALLLLLALTKLFDFVTGQSYRKAVSRAQQRCKQLLYRRFLSCPLNLLYGMEHGQAVELLNDDFHTVTGKALNLYPGFFTGLATFIAYFAFLLARNLPAALALLVISLLQVIPPMVVKGFLEKNYSDTRDIEAQITNCTMEYYHGFETIKIFGLKQWCLDRLARLHKDYLWIGNRSEAACTAETALDRLIGNILTYGTYGLMGLFVLKGYTGLETGVEAIALSGGLYAAAKTLFDTIPSFAVARTADKRMAVLYTHADILDEAESIVGKNPTHRTLNAENTDYTSRTDTKDFVVLPECSDADTVYPHVNTDSKSRTSFYPDTAIQGAALSHCGTVIRKEASSYSTEIRNAGSVICLNGVSCNLGGKQLLTDVDICIPADRISVIRGANGIGKSTLLKLLLGMILPDAGSVSIGGMPSPALPRSLFPNGLFYLPQEDPAFHLPADELYTCIPGIDTDAACAIAERFSLTPEILRQPVDTLSGGQRKKVFLALAFALNPELMLLDEPCNSLDTESRRVLIQLLRERGGGTVIITHDATFDGIADTFYTVQNVSGQGTIIEEQIVTA